MHPRIKFRPNGENHAIVSAKPLVWHDVTNQTASANAAARRRMIAGLPASSTANHARPLVSRHPQA